MPTLPASGYAVPVAPTVEPLSAPLTPYQDIRGATAETFGGATGEALTRLGAQFGQAADRFENIQAFYDQVAADEQVNFFEDNLNKLLYGDPSKPGDVGYMGLQGRNAMDKRDETRKAIDQQINEQRSRITSLRQQHLFDQQTRRYRNYALSAIGRHYDDQFNKWTASTAENTAKLAVNRGSIAANNNDFGGFKEALGAAANGLQTSMTAMGKPKEEVDVAIQTLTKNMATQWAKTRIEKDPVEAQKFIEENKDHLGDTYDDLLRASRAKALDMQADDIVAGRKGKRPSNLIRGGAVQQQVSAEAAAQGVTDRLALTTASIESDFGRSPDRPGSQYQGVFQLGDAEGRALGGKGIEHGVALLKQRKGELAVRLGREPEDWEVYLAHNQGVAGAVSLLQNPTMSAGDAIVRAGGRRVNISSNFKGDPDAPASAFTQAVKEKFNERANKIVKVAEEGVIPQGTPAQRDAFFAYNQANPDATLTWQEFLAKQPTSTDKGVDTLLQNLPPLEANEISDSEVPGLVDFLKQKAKDIPPDADPKLWPTVVKKARQLYNMQYTAQQQQERLRRQAQDKADHDIGDEYVTRMAPGSTNVPSETEILQDKRISDTKKQGLVGFLRSFERKDPDPAKAHENFVEAFKRLGLEDSDPEKLRTEGQIDQLFSQKMLTWPMHQELIKIFREKQGASNQIIQQRMSAISKAAEPYIFPLKHIQGGLLADPGGPEREAAFQIYMLDQVRKMQGAGKNPLDLFRPGTPESPNPDYIGRKELMREFGKGAKGGLDATMQDGNVGELKSLPDVVAAWKTGKFGPYGSDAARQRAMDYAAQRGFGTIGPSGGAPIR